MSRQTPNRPDPSHHPTCTCPSCGQRSRFSYIGEQRWPEAIAKRRGVASVSLWECAACGSSVDGLRLDTSATAGRA